MVLEPIFENSFAGALKVLLIENTTFANGASSFAPSGRYMVAYATWNAS